MLKIDVAERADGATAHIEGQLIGPWVAELERVCTALLSGGRDVKIDLARVSFVARDGAELLCRLCECGAALENCSPLVAEQLKGRARRTG